MYKTFPRGMGLMQVLRAVALLIAAIPCFGDAAARETVRLNAATGSLSLTPFLSLYRDPTARKKLEEVRQDWDFRSFSPAGTQRPAFGFTPDAIWARWTVRNEADSPAFWVIQLKTTRMDEVDLHLVSPAGAIRHFAAGNARPRSPDLLDDVYPSFPLELAAGEELDVYARIHSETALQLPLHMIPSEHLPGLQARTQLMHAGFFGYLIALMILGFLFGMIAHERGFLLYSVALICCFACYFILSGHYAWFDFPGRAFAAKSGMILTSEFALFMMLIYLRYLLELPRTLPGINRLVTWTLAVSGILVLTLVLMPYRIAYPAILIHMSLIGSLSVAVACYAWYKGLKVARFYAVAWILFWIFFGLSSVKHIAGVSVSRPFWENAFEGTALSMTFFFIAMADRVREIRRVAARAQEQLLKLERQASKDLRQKLRQEQLLIRDLHDGIGGLTANLAILAEVGRRDSSVARDQSRFERISQIASDGSAEVRSLMSTLEARDLSWPDFFDECRRFGRVSLSPHQVEFTCCHSGYTGQTGPGVFAGLSLLRVVKEAMTNAVKHANGTTVMMQVDFIPDRVRIAIRDNGTGFAQTIRKGRGLGNMETRVAEMGGTWICRGESGRGVEIVVDLPLPLHIADQPPESPA